MCHGFGIAMHAIVQTYVSQSQSHLVRIHFGLFGNFSVMPQLSCINVKWRVRERDVCIHYCFGNKQHTRNTHISVRTYNNGTIFAYVI